jgi:SAM-dependent methyltransferase
VSEAPVERVLLNVGSGALDASSVPAYFSSWRQVRVDVDRAVNPDVVADLTDLSPIASGSADAVWAAHCIEHLYEHQVRLALAEFRRVLRDDGFACVIVPDLQLVARYVMEDKLHEPIYQSPAGSVTPHDIFFGFGPAIASGRTSMAHRCGFTPGMLQRCFKQQAFAELFLRRRSADFELAVIARVKPAQDDDERNALVSALGL